MTEANEVQEKPLSLIRTDEVLRRTGMRKSWLWAAIKEQTFPAPVRISARAVGFVESEIQDWIKARVRASRFPS